MSTPPHLHQGHPIAQSGVPLAAAHAAVVLVHGRGADADDMLGLAARFTVPRIAYLAPQAAGGTWYPQRFTAPVAANEPWLTSALLQVGAALDLVAAAGIAPEHTLLGGFSQGACLALEYAARHPQRYGGLIGLSGALIENGDAPRLYTGTLAGTPVFLGCSVPDPHIPQERVERTAILLEGLGASVTLRLYPQMGHTVSPAEIAIAQAMIAAASTAATGSS